MAFFGAIINTIKGTSDSIKLYKEIKDLDSKITTCSDIETYLKGLPSLEHIEVYNDLLMAEYIIKRSNIQPNNINEIVSLWERVKLNMNAELEKLEKELQSETANKLDIARLVATLTKISGELDKEILLFKDELSVVKQENELFKDKLCNQIQEMISQYSSKLDEFANKLELLKKLLLWRIIPIGLILLVVLVLILR